MYPLSSLNCLISWPDGQGPIFDQACLDQQVIDYNNWYQVNVQPVQDQLYRDLRSQTPWFSVQALADTLYLYANGVTDLTRSGSAIHVSANPGLCLDVFGASPDAGTKVELYTCNGNPASQAWSYDRLHQTIVEPNSGLCLYVQNANPAPQAPVWMWWCNGTSAQRWTYDPQYGTLTNVLGTVLDVPNDNLQSGQALWTWTWNATDAQRWQ